MNKKNNIKYQYIFIAFIAGLLNFIGLSAQLNTKTLAEKKAATYTIMQDPIASHIFCLGEVQNIIFRLKEIKTYQEIGYAHFTYNQENKALELVTFYIDAQYTNKKLGSYLLKYTLSQLPQNFNSASIQWTAFPFLDETQESLDKLIRFYKRLGAIDKGIYEGVSAKMIYPVNLSHVLACLMPILEPSPQSIDEKQIKLANGSTYNTSRFDPFIIIVSYIDYSE